MRTAALVLLLTLAGCVGSIRESTTARTAEEQLLCTTAALHAVANIDSSRFAHRKVFIDVTPLAVQVDRGYVVDAFTQLVSEAGGRLAPAADKADLVIEVRSAALGTYEGKWNLFVPTFYVGAVLPATDAPPLLQVGYRLHEGWAKINAWCYEPKTGEYVCGWRDSWGRAYQGIFDDIYPDSSISDSLKSRVQ